MNQYNEKQIKSAIFEILYIERKNLRSKAFTDLKMADEIGKIISESSKLSK